MYSNSILLHMQMRLLAALIPHVEEWGELVVSSHHTVPLTRPRRTGITKFCVQQTKIAFSEARAVRGLTSVRVKGTVVR